MYGGRNSSPCPDRVTVPETVHKLPFLRPLLAMFAVALLAQAFVFVFSFAVLETWEERGQFGDSFGFIDTIFSGFALCGVIYSLSFQLREHVRQRREARGLAESDLETRKALIMALESQTAELRAMRQHMSVAEQRYRS
jgi:hypothetical protein